MLLYIRMIAEGYNEAASTSSDARAPVFCGRLIGLFFSKRFTYNVNTSKETTTDTAPTVNNT